MAHSDYPYSYAPGHLEAIARALSPERFGTYLESAGFHEEYALALYLYNARLAKSFLFPLHVAEITLRNSIDAYLARRYGASWHTDAALRVGVFTPQSSASLDKAIRHADNSVERADVIAELTFDFWSNLLRSDYSQTIWRTGLRTIFPGLPRDLDRRSVQRHVRQVNMLRNRVTHHEPILDVNVQEVLGSIFDLVGWCSDEMRAWARHHNTVSETIRSRPSGQDQLTVDLRSRMAPGFAEVKVDTPFVEAMAMLGYESRSLVCVDAHGAPLCAWTALEILEFVTRIASEQAGMFDMADHTVADIVATSSSEDRWVAMNADEPMTNVTKRLQNKKTGIVVAIEPGTGRVVGTIQRAHRRY